jgi:hypothetical protein
MYTNQLNDLLGASKSARVFSEVSDTLLCIGVVMVILAIGAITVSWRSGMARNLFIVSILVLSLEFLIPFFHSSSRTPKIYHGQDTCPKEWCPSWRLLGYTNISDNN